MQNDNKIKVYLTRQAWTDIGIKANWFKTAGQPPVRLSTSDLIKRFKILGWTITAKKDGVHYMFTSPQGDKAIIVGMHNYERKSHLWKAVMGDFLRYSKDLKFAFVNPFIIPEGFNKKTQRIETTSQSDPETLERSVTLLTLPSDFMTNQVVKIEGTWKKPFDIDYNNNTIMFNDGSLMTLKSTLEPITIKQLACKTYRIIRIGKVILT